MILFINTGEHTEKISKDMLTTVFRNTNSPLGTTNPTLSKLEFFPQKTLSVKNQHRCIKLSNLVQSSHTLRVFFIKTGN